MLYGVDRLAAFAQEHGVKFSHIVLDRGRSPSQPMLTIRGRGTLAEQRDLVRHWQTRLREVSIHPTRVKIEAAPRNDGVPHTDEQALAEPQDRYFEHHVKVLLADTTAARLIALTHLVMPHGARLSRNARRHRADGRQERFITQRCHQVGRETAHRRLDALIAALRADGQDIVEVEEEYVVYDSAIGLDSGWLQEAASSANSAYEHVARHAPEGAPGYPSTYRPLPTEAGIRQRAAFDPALKQFRHAYRAGEPQFADEQTEQRWRAARRDAMTHLLRLTTASSWSQNLVLRGSVPLQAWIGDIAREPGDLDFVVTPPTMLVTNPEAVGMLDGIVAAVRDCPGAGLRADGVASEDIWTYERAPGRRLIFPFAVSDLPGGTIQLDFVFQENLPVPPTVVRIPPLDDPVLTASPQLSLAWKLLWLETDMWPQGKDLYDATLLAEYATISLDLVRDVLRPELGAEADSFTAASVLAWTIDWNNFRDEYPSIHGDATAWQERLALALARSFGE